MAKGKNVGLFEANGAHWRDFPADDPCGQHQYEHTGCKNANIQHQNLPKLELYGHEIDVIGVWIEFDEVKMLL